MPYHIPILLHETLKELNIQKNGIYVDATLGGGGHSAAILQNLDNTGALFGIDRDREAIAEATERLKGFNNFHPIWGNYHDISEILNDHGINGIDGILFDLGVSSHQFDCAERGFSYRADAYLDMRMDQSRGRTAADILNTASLEELSRIIRDNGEEKWARRIASFIIERRRLKPICTTSELVEIIEAAIPAKVRFSEKGHPAKRTFQALRIEVNNELLPLENTIRNVVDFLKPQGRICVITFHSLEDRIIKSTFRQLEHPCTCPPDAPICICHKKPVVRIIKPEFLRPSEDEIRQNPRAASAKLRCAEKVDP